MQTTTDWFNKRVEFLSFPLFSPRRLPADPPDADFTLM